MLGFHGVYLCLALWFLYLFPSHHHKLAVFYSVLVVFSFLFSQFRSKKFHRLPTPSKGSVALVTGGSSGIGRALTMELANKGFDLVIVALEENDLTSTKKDIETKYKGRIRVVTIQKDLSSETACQEVYDAVRALKLEVVVLVNAAGFGSNGWFVEGSIDTYCRMIRLNDIASVKLTSLFAPHMVTRKEGDILFVSSITGCAPIPLQAVYGASKAFITSFATALHHELEPLGVKVTCLLPGATTSGFASRSNCTTALIFNLPLGIAVSSPDFVAQTAMNAMDHDNGVLWGVWGRGGDWSTGGVVVGYVNAFYAYVLAHFVPPKIAIALSQLSFTPWEMLMATHGRGVGGGEQKTKQK